MSNAVDNKTEVVQPAEKVRKPRIKLTPAESIAKRRAAIQKAQESLKISEAKVALDNVASFREASAAKDKHCKFVLEGTSLLDDEAYNKRVANLETRLSNLKAKRVIAQKDTVQRKALLDTFEKVQVDIGAYIGKCLENGQTVTTEDVAKMFNSKFTSAQRAEFSNIDDPYKAFRREKKVVANIEGDVLSTDTSDGDLD